MRGYVTNESLKRSSGGSPCSHKMSQVYKNQSNFIAYSIKKKWMV